MQPVWDQRFERALMPLSHESCSSCSLEDERGRVTLVGTSPNNAGERRWIRWIEAIEFQVE